MIGNIKEKEKKENRASGNTNFERGPQSDVQKGVNLIEREEIRKNEGSRQRRFIHLCPINIILYVYIFF